MRIVVTGSRDYPNEERVRQELTDLFEDYYVADIAQGGAAGADEFARTWANDQVSGSIYQTTCVTYEADWEVYGKAAGPRRNELMIDTFKPELVLAFWDGKSKGTLHCLSYAVSKGIDVRICAA